MANIVKPNRDKISGAALEYIAPTIEDGENVIKFTKDEVASEIQRWEHSVVMYVLGTKPPFVVMKAFVEQKWRKYGRMEIYLLKTGVYIVSFVDKHTQERVIDEGPWSFDDMPLIVDPICEFGKRGGE